MSYEIASGPGGSKARGYVRPTRYPVTTSTAGKGCAPAHAKPCGSRLIMNAGDGIERMPTTTTLMESSQGHSIAGMDIKQITLPHLCQHGLREFGLRPLSNSRGKFTGVVLTRTIAESAPLSQISKQLRDLYLDIDGTWTSSTNHKDRPPHKVHEATKFIKPIVDIFIQAIKPVPSTAPPTRTRSRPPRRPRIGFRNYKRKPPNTNRSYRAHSQEEGTTRA